jgi:DNA-binding transcriptional MerR regulator
VPVADRAYLSIGEVLNLLRDEFPDITISKIRFLESQGLLDPERTPSGYRKFYEGDVERLRWILRQQREHFLPLKVIKGRLRDEPWLTENQPAPARVAAVKPTNHAPAEAHGLAVEEAIPIDTTWPDEADAAEADLSMTADELAAAAGITLADIDELERFGLVEPRRVGGSAYYDEEALIVAKLAAGFQRFGVEARHLRTYKNAADREAGIFEQVVIPLLKQRNPEARRHANESLAELSALGQGLRAAMLRRALRGYTST